MPSSKWTDANRQARIAYRVSLIGWVFALCLLWRPLFAGGAFFWGTPLLQFVPWQRMAAEMWRAGHWPLWNPLLGCGAPLAANYQTGAFYPLNLLYLWLPAEVAMVWTAAFHLGLAGWGMYRWGRAVGLEEFPAALSGLAYAGSGFLVSRVALFPSMVVAFPWISVWLWRGELLVQAARGRAKRRAVWRAVLWLGLAMGLGLLAGHAQTAFYGGVLLAAYMVFRAIQEARSQKQGVGGIAARLAAAVGIGLGLAAVQLLPTAGLMLASQRVGGVNYDFAMTYSLWPWRLISFVAPDFFGNPGRGDYWGYPNYWEGAGYVGLLPLLLALLPISCTGVQLNVPAVPSARFWRSCALVGLLLALGKNTPIFPFLFRHVPGFDVFQAPARWLAVVTTALAALAGLGAQARLSDRGEHRPAAQRLGALGVTFGAALLLAGLAAAHILAGAGDGPATFAPATMRLGGLLLVAGALMLLRRPLTRRAAWWRAAVGGFVVLDLLLAGRPLIPTVDRALYRGGTEAAATLRADAPLPRVYWPTDLISPASEYDAEYRVKFTYLDFATFGPRDVKHWWEVRESLLPNVGMLDGIASANNFDSLLLARYVDMLDAVVTRPSLLRVMGVTHIVSDRPWPGGEPLSARHVPSATLYRLPDALGRAWVAPSARYVPADEMLTALSDSSFDPTAEVLLEIPPPASVPQRQLSYTLTLRDVPNGVTIHAVLDTPGYLVLADTWTPGWHARVDGRPVALWRANYLFRAVYLEAGEHTVEMTYRPQAAIYGATISLLSLLLWIVGISLPMSTEWKSFSFMRRPIAYRSHHPDL